MDGRKGAIVAVLSMIAFGLGAAFAAEDGYEASIEKWRQEKEASLKADDGWLTVSGLFWLTEGENRFGSGPQNDFVLPGTAPEDVGVFELKAGQVSARIHPGVSVTMNGKPVQAAELKPSGPGPADTLVFGTRGGMSLFVHKSGERLAIRLKDKESKIRREFTGLKWFKVNESYRVQARLVPYEKPKTVRVPNILGDLETYTAPGYLVFDLGGQETKLEAFDTGKSFFIVFRDLTSGKETYPAARFLYADLPKDGQTVLDFNKAYNPPCAFTPFTTCPLPPEMNRLRQRVSAGEMDYGHGPSETH